MEVGGGELNTGGQIAAGRISEPADPFERGLGWRGGLR